MNVSPDLSILHLILNASAVVQVVLAILARRLLHVLVLHLQEVVHRPRRGKTNRTVRARFLVGGDLNSLYQSAVNIATCTGEHGAHFRGRFPRIYQAAQPEEPGPQGHDRRFAPRHARHLPARDRQYRIAPRLPGLGRLGLPYVGLFGTVWGIMHSFRGLSNVGQATLSAVAPASPRRWSPPPSACSPPFRRCSPTTASRTKSTAWPCAFESFMEEFSNILQRQMRWQGGRNAPTPPENEINVVPYIDVMLVLLVIFMVATPMMTTAGSPSVCPESVRRPEAGQNLKGRGQPDGQPVLRYRGKETK